MQTLLTLGFLLMLQIAETPGSFQTVSGLVLGPDGKPIAEAIVLVETISQSGGINPIYRSDSNGRFSYQALPGRYKVSVFKKSEGYPIPIIGYSPADLGQSLTLDVAQSSTDFVMHLGVPLGIIKCVATDRRDGSLLNTVNYKLVHADTQEKLILSSAGVGGFFEAAPPFPFRVIVEAKGYEPWRSEPLNLERGSRKQINVTLTPKKASSAP